MMIADKLLLKLNHVSSYSRDRWRAICPAHESKKRTQSLAIRELDDGTLLIRCFAGCSADQVVRSVGLRLSDLFPNSPKSRSSIASSMFHARKEALEALTEEALLVAVAAENICQGIPIGARDLNRIASAAVRIRFALEACK